MSIKGWIDIFTFLKHFTSRGQTQSSSLHLRNNFKKMRGRTGFWSQARTRIGETVLKYRSPWTKLNRGLKNLKEGKLSSSRNTSPTYSCMRGESSMSAPLWQESLSEEWPNSFGSMKDICGLVPGDSAWKTIMMSTLTSPMMQCSASANNMENMKKGTSCPIENSRDSWKQISQGESNTH